MLETKSDLGAPAFWNFGFEVKHDTQPTGQPAPYKSHLGTFARSVIGADSSMGTTTYTHGSLESKRPQSTVPTSVSEMKSSMRSGSKSVIARDRNAEGVGAALCD